PRLQSKGAVLLHRGGQSAARARVAGVRRCQTARRQDPDAGGRRALRARIRRAPGAGGAAPRTLRPTRRQRECHRRDRLWIAARRARLHPVGEVPRNGGGRRDRFTPTLEQLTMKISSVKVFHCDAGWRPWTFVKVETDSGLVGWGECSDSRNPLGIAGCVRDFEPVLVGEDPRAVQRLDCARLRTARQDAGGISHKAIAGIELALWDIKAKALGVPVYELFGGPLRDRMRLYWSHCGTTRARHGAALGLPPLRTYDDVVALGREVVERGFTALK